MIPSWMRNITFVAWLASMFLPSSIINPDVRPYVAAGFTLVLGASSGKDFVDKLRGEKKE